MEAVAVDITKAGQRVTELRSVADACRQSTSDRVHHLVRVFYTISEMIINVDGATDGTLPATGLL